MHAYVRTNEDFTNRSLQQLSAAVNGQRTNEVFEPTQEMRGKREITTTRAVLLFFIGTLVGILFSPTLKQFFDSGEHKGFVDEPLRSPAVQRTGVDNAHSNVIHGKASACSCDVSRLSFPLEASHLHMSLLYVSRPPMKLVAIKSRFTHIT